MTQQQNVNFLPEDYVEKRAAHRSAVMVVGLIVLELVAIVGGYWYLRQSPMNIERAEQQRLDQKQEMQSKEIAEFQDSQQQERTMQHKVELMSQLMERVSRSTLLERLHAAVGNASRFTLIDLKTKEVAAKTIVKPDDRNPIRTMSDGVRLPTTETTIEVTGLSPSHEHVAQFLDRLGKIELVEGPQPVFSEEFRIEDKVYRRFKVTMKINPAADTRFAGQASTGGKRN